MAAKEFKFELKLFVNGEQAEESNNFNLWQSVYRAIKSAKGKPSDKRIETAMLGQGLMTHITDEDEEEAVNELAKMLGISAQILKGACDPKREEPYIHLDMHFWSDWRKNLPKRGPNSVSPIALAANFMALWFQKAGLGSPTLQKSMKVLDIIGVEVKNANRSINNCEWIQLRAGKKIQVNPSAIGKAIEVAKAFCEKRPPKLNND